MTIGSTIPSPRDGTTRTGRDFSLAAWSAPVSRVLLPCVGLAAAWETRASTLLAVGGPVLGAILQAVLWMILYAVLVVVIGTVAPADRQSVSRVSRRLGMALLLGLASARVTKVEMSSLLEPAGWIAFHYLRLFVAPAFAAIWCAALLPGEVRALVQAARRNDSIAPLPALVVLFIAAAVLVSCSDLAFQLVREGSAVQHRLAVDLIKWQAWLTTTVILFLVEALVFAVTSSAATALLLVSPIFATMVFASLVKIRFMHSAVQPFDLLTLPEFMPLFGSFFGTWAAIGSAIAIVCWLIALVVCWRRARTRVPAGRRVAIGVTSFALLAALVIAFLPPSVLPSPLAARSDAMYTAVTALGAPEGEHREMARTGGIVLNFLSELGTAFVVVPQDYSAARIYHVMRG